MSTAPPMSDGTMRRPSISTSVRFGPSARRSIVAVPPFYPSLGTGTATTMRAEMARHKPPAGPLDAKLLPGGLVDLEFTVHVAQLRVVTWHPGENDPVTECDGRDAALLSGAP